ncbi:hypothetical protein HOLleu_18672 [Holothuria leucospilota]|uniref:Uncharacterized protein n=1 Tax=Holothuria leucospilota TaxID=206669 RepID=A0A9Q1C480_HOLLE|nr:hypothetical protein HOLleu_18672 [Holothuria leucospilota]
MRFAVYWTGFFTILLILPEKTYSNYCDLPIDSQCLTGCYYYHGNCLKCTNCTRDQLVDIERYHRDECLSFPAFCKIQKENVNWREYATDFHPPQCASRSHHIDDCAARCSQRRMLGYDVLDARRV